MRVFVLIVMACLLSQCAGLEIPSVFNKGVKEQPRFGKDAVLYACDNKQSFGLKLSEDGSEAWLMLPDHEVGLLRDSSDKQLYHYGTVDLRLNGDQTTLDDADHLHFTSCKAQISKQ